MPIASYLLGGMTKYRARRGSIVVRKWPRGEVYLEKGALLPSNAEQTHIEHLLAQELIEPVEGNNE